MTALKSLQANDIQFYGEQGNASVAWSGYTLAAMQIADTVDLFYMPGGVDLVDCHMINAALGANSTLALGWRNADGSAGGSATALFAATATSSAGRVNMDKAPITLPIKDAIIYATLAGGAGTGQIDVVLDYRVKGTK